jgi:hypothetical protein
VDYQDRRRSARERIIAAEIKKLELRQTRGVSPRAARREPAQGRPQTRRREP